MTNKELVLSTLTAQGKAMAQVVQDSADGMTATELVAKRDYIPRFSTAIVKVNMLDRPIGFAVKTALGNVCRLLNVYNSDVYPGEPETLPAQWGFKWPQDPALAKAFVALSTSPYMTGDCCLDGSGAAKRSTIDGNVWPPDTNPEFWDDVEENQQYWEVIE